MAISAELYDLVVKIVDERVEKSDIIRQDFSELRGIVAELAQAQKAAEGRLTGVERAIEKLAQAQKASEDRLTRVEQAIEKLAQAQQRTEERVEELAQAQKASEDRLTRVEQIIQELAQAQKASEERLTRVEQAIQELAQAQKASEERLTRVEQAIQELAQAQKASEERLTRVEQAIEELAQAQKKTEEALAALSVNVGRLSDNIGFGLEDIARLVLPGYLERHLHIFVEELTRKFFVVDSKEVEIDLYGEGKREDGEEVIILGESKSRIYGREAADFAKQAILVEQSLQKPVIKVMFGYYIHPTASEVARENDILLVASYQR
ncbi:MAG: hypothetical protein AB1797_02210 [bacterium]